MGATAAGINFMRRRIFSQGEKTSGTPVVRTAQQRCGSQNYCAAERSHDQTERAGQQK